jgi:hypothetical protein
MSRDSKRILVVFVVPMKTPNKIEKRRNHISQQFHNHSLKDYLSYAPSAPSML